MVVFHVKQGPFLEDFFQCVTYGFYTAEWQEHLYTVFTLICGFLLPLFILVTTYILTVVTLHRKFSRLIIFAFIFAKVDI